MRDELIPDPQAILAWIAQIHAQGIRRPGYPADRWAETFCAARFRSFGLEQVRLEPVRLPGWEPRAWSLHACGATGELELDCFPLPHSAPTGELELELAAFDPAMPSGVSGKAALHDAPLVRMPPGAAVGMRRVLGDGAFPDDADAIPGGRIRDPRGTFENAEQVLPFSPLIMEVMEPALAAGAAAYIGVLSGYPGDSCEYYVPYDAVSRPIPGVWIRGSDGARLRALLARGPVHLRLRIDATREQITCHNVIGELPGADDEQVVIGSHHDGPWSSAVEDASGIALVLAQAAYWSKLPASERPHRLVFLLNAGHMAGGAGCHAFLETHAERLARIVLSIHLEHAACEFAERDGKLVPTGEPEPRWLFTSRIARLEAAVADALDKEGLDRALLLPPDAFGPQPTTDGGPFHPKGVPLINYLTAPFYLFDRSDDMDKIHVPSLGPITRATIRWIDATRGVSAADMRAGLR